MLLIGWSLWSSSLWLLWLSLLMWRELCSGQVGGNFGEPEVVSKFRSDMFGQMSMELLLLLLPPILFLPNLPPFLFFVLFAVSSQTMKLSNDFHRRGHSGGGGNRDPVVQTLLRCALAGATARRTDPPQMCSRQQMVALLSGRAFSSAPRWFLIHYHCHRRHLVLRLPTVSVLPFDLKASLLSLSLSLLVCCGCLSDQQICSK